MVESLGKRSRSKGRRGTRSFARSFAFSWSENDGGESRVKRRPITIEHSGVVTPVAAAVENFTNPAVTALGKGEGGDLARLLLLLREVVTWLQHSRDLQL